MSRTAKVVGHGFLGFFGLLTAPAWAQVQGIANYPSKPIVIILPVSPGGAHDVEVRAWTELIGKSLNATFVRDYKSGGGTVQGMVALANAKPDGYTLGTSTINMALTPLRYDEPPFDPIKSFAHISELNRRVSSLLASTSVPISNVKEYVAYAKANPGVLNFSASGEGSVDHISGAWLMSATGTKVTFIHYKSAGSQTSDFLSGRTHLLATTVSEGGQFAALMQGGKTRVVGIQALARSPIYPDIPTLDEQGITGMNIPSFVGLQAPAGTPTAIIDKLYAEVVKASKLPELQKRVGSGTIIAATPAAEYRRMLQGITVKFGQLAKEMNINMKGDD